MNPPFPIFQFLFSIFEVNYPEFSNDGLDNIGSIWTNISTILSNMQTDDSSYP